MEKKRVTVSMSVTIEGTVLGRKLTDEEIDEGGCLFETEDSMINYASDELFELFTNVVKYNDNFDEMLTIEVEDIPNLIPFKDVPNDREFEFEGERFYKIDDENVQSYDKDGNEDRLMGWSPDSLVELLDEDDYNYGS